MREEREREKRSWDSGETERAFFLTTRARCLLWPSRWTRKSLAQPGPPGRAGIRIRRRQGKIVHQARPGGRAGRQAGRRAGQGVEGGRVSSAAKDLRSLGQWFGFGLACDGWVGVVGGLLLGLVEGGIASCGWASVGVTMLRQCLQLGAQSRYPVKPAGVDMGIAFGGLSLVKHAQTNRCPMRQADRQSDASMSPLRGPDVVCRRQGNAERYSSMYKHRCGYGRGRTLRRRSADGQGADALKLPLVGIEIGCCRNRARTSVDTVMSRSARGTSRPCTGTQVRQGISRSAPGGCEVAPATRGKPKRRKKDCSGGQNDQRNPRRDQAKQR